MIRVDIDKTDTPTNGAYVDQVFAVCQLFGVDTSGMNRFLFNSEEIFISEVIDGALSELKNADCGVNETDNTLTVWR